MTFNTTDKPDEPIVIPCDGKWRTFSTVVVPGAAGEPVASGFYVNLSGLFVPGERDGKVEVRALRDGKVEGQIGFDETGISTQNLLWDYLDGLSGLYFYRHKASFLFAWSRNMSTLAWQIRSLRRVKTLTIKESVYSKATDFDRVGLDS